MKTCQGTTWFSLDTEKQKEREGENHTTPLQNCSELGLDEVKQKHHQLITSGTLAKMCKYGSHFIPIIGIIIHILDSVSKNCQMKMAEPKRQKPIKSKRKELTTLRYPVLEALELDRLW